MAFTLVACGGGGSGGGGGGGSSQPAGGGGGGGGAAPSGAPVEITVAFFALPNGLCAINEDTFQTISPVVTFYDNLVFLGKDWEWKPAVASSWKQVDPLNWQFEINMDHKFHNGDPLTMDDVVYSIERLKGIPKSAHCANRIKSVTYEGNILNVELTEANNTTIPQMLWFTVIVNKKYCEEKGDEALFLKPIGTGPYVCTEFTPGASVRVEKWADYPFEKPQIDIINFIAIPEDTNRYIAVETGQVEVAGIVTAFEVELAKKDGRFNIYEGMSCRTITFYCNMDREPFKSNQEVRRAFAHAFDRESWCDLAGGRVPLLSSLFGGFDLHYISQYLPEYNPAKAKEILEAAGISPANPINIELIHFQADPGLELYQSAMKSLGVNIQLTLCEFSVFLAREGSADFDLVWVGLSNKGGGPLVDLERYDSTFFGSRNNSRYSNPVMDDMIRKMRTTIDPNELQQLNVAINDLAAQESVFWTTHLQSNYAVMDKNLEGVWIRGDVSMHFRDAIYNG